MKRNLFLSGLLIVILALGFTGCGNDDSDGDSNFLGAQLNITDLPIYNVTEGEFGNPILGTRFTGSGTVHHGGFVDWGGAGFISVGGMGEITDGLLTFTVGIPTQTRSIQQAFSDLAEGFTNFNISAPDARVAELERILATAEGFNADLQRVWGNDTTDERIIYVYADRNVRVTGQGRTVEEQGFTLTTSNLNLDLRTGWNAITHTTTVNFATMVVTQSITQGVAGRTRWVLLTF